MGGILLLLAARAPDRERALGRWAFQCVDRLTFLSSAEEGAAKGERNKAVLIAVLDTGRGCLCRGGIHPVVKIGSRFLKGKNACIGLKAFHGSMFCVPCFEIYIPSLFSSSPLWSANFKTKHALNI